jgi:hypothetical protein
MKITLVTLTIACISLLEVVRTLIKFKMDRIGIRAGILWVCLWLGILFFSLFPAKLDFVFNLSSMANRLYFLFLLAIYILFILVFELHSKVETLSHRVSKLNHELAIARYSTECIYSTNEEKATTKTENKNQLEEYSDVSYSNSSTPDQ